MNHETLTLLEEKKFPQLCRILKQMNPADLAILFAEFPEDYLPVLFRILPKELAAETFVCMDADLQEVLITTFSDRELREVLDEMYMDDTVDIIEEMPSNVVARILKNSNPEDRKTINELLKYPGDSAGSIMTTEYVYLKKDMSVRDAFSRIRKIGPDKETIYTCYVTDAGRKLVGVVTVKDLLLAQPESVINDIMATNVIFVDTLEDKEIAARLFEKYDLLAVPVVDQEQRLVGIITVDDAMDVLREENTEDIMKMSAIKPTYDTYLKTTAFKHAKNRIVWLLILMVSATITGAIITKYEATFTAIPLLIAFLPMLMDTGGNCGSQSSTIIIRGLALGEIKTRDFFKVLFKEVGVALMVGVVLAVVNTGRVLITYPNDPIKFQLALVTGLALISAVLIAKILGCCLPMAAQKLKIDPALMAAPLMTTIVDAGAVLIYFSIATSVMNLAL